MASREESVVVASAGTQAAHPHAALESQPSIRPTPASRAVWRWAREIARYAILVVASLAGIFPVLWMVTVAMKDQAEYANERVGLPDALSLSNFSSVLSDPQFLKYVLNSVIVVGVAVPVLTITSVMAGYALARLWGRAGIPILFVFLTSELIPLPIVAIPLL